MKFRTRSISGCCSRSCTISAWPPLAAKCRGELSWPLSKFGLQFPFSSNSLVASTLPCLDGTKQNLTTIHHHSQGKLQFNSDSPAGVVNGSPVVTVQLFDWEPTVQKLREQLCISFTGTTMEGEVVHPLPLPADNINKVSNRHFGFVQTAGKFNLLLTSALCVTLLVVLQVAQKTLWNPIGAPRVFRLGQIQLESYLKLPPNLVWIQFAFDYMCVFCCPDFLNEFGYNLDFWICQKTN